MNDTFQKLIIEFCSFQKWFSCHSWLLSPWSSTLSLLSTTTLTPTIPPICNRLYFKMIFHTRVRTPRIGASDAYSPKKQIRINMRHKYISWIVEKWFQSSVSARTLSNFEDGQGDVFVDKALLVVGVDFHQDRLRYILVIVDLRINIKAVKRRTNS